MKYKIWCRNQLEKRINIIFAGNFLYPEGLADAKRIQQLIDYLYPVRGIELKVLLFRQSHPGRDTHRLSGWHKGIQYTTLGHDLYISWRLPWVLIRYFVGGISYLLKHRRTDCRNVIYLYNEPNIENFIFILLARWMGYRVIVDIVEDFFLIQKNAPLISKLKAVSVKIISKHILWFVDAVVAISCQLKKKYDSITKRKIPVYHLPISVHFSCMPPATGKFNHPALIFYAGSFGEKDGVENLIDAFNRVCQKKNDIEMILAGKGVKERMDFILDKIKKSPFGQKIRYLGFLPDDKYFRVMRGCDILCCVRNDSDYANQGFPFKLGEYLSSARPVVASETGDIARYLTDRKTAFLVTPGSTESITAAIEYALTHEHEALEVGRSGRKVAESHFNSIANGEKLYSVISNLKF